MKIGFIGLGNMGLPMASNLVRGGYEVHGYDLVPAALEAFQRMGGRPASTPAEAFAGAAAVITMLPNAAHVEALYLSDEDLLSHIPKTALLIDCSTVAIAAIRALSETLKERGYTLIDAPVSGGTEGAKAGTLTIMAGGCKKHVEQARPILEKMSARIVHAGEVGTGQAAKVCNNMVLGIVMIANSEALQLGIANGLDPELLSEIIGMSSGGNWALSHLNPCPGIVKTAPSSQGYVGRFSVDLMVKDLGLSIEAARDKHVTTRLGAMAMKLFSEHAASGNGSRDFSSIFTTLAPERDI